MYSDLHSTVAVYHIGVGTKTDRGHNHRDLDTVVREDALYPEADFWRKFSGNLLSRASGQIRTNAFDILSPTTSTSLYGSITEVDKVS